MHTWTSHQRSAVQGSWINRSKCVPSCLYKRWASHTKWGANKGSCNKSIAQSHSGRICTSNSRSSLLYGTEITCLSNYNNIYTWMVIDSTTVKSMINDSQESSGELLESRHETLQGAIWRWTSCCPPQSSISAAASCQFDPCWGLLGAQVLQTQSPHDT